jgi:hypothetical protein
MDSVLKIIVWAAVAFAVIYFVVSWTVGWNWFTDVFKKPTTTTIVSYVPDTLTAQIMGFKIDSLKGELNERAVIIDREQKEKKVWRDRVSRLEAMIISMRDSLTDTVHTYDAILSGRFPSEPDSSGEVYMDSLHVEYNIALDMWHDILLGLQPRKVPYLKTVIETIKEVPYIPLWVAIPFATVMLILIGAVAF